MNNKELKDLVDKFDKKLDKVISDVHNIDKKVAGLEALVKWIIGGTGLITLISFIIYIFTSLTK